jgi:predicted secreted hydrolase
VEQAGAGQPRPALDPPLTVYLDDWRQRATVRGRAERWSHLLADDPDELHALAGALGIPRRGYQVHRRSAALNHYDLPEGLRDRAIALGAVPVTWRQMARLTREWRRAGVRPAPADPP